MKPTLKQLRPVNPLLSNMLLAYMQDSSMFAARQIAVAVDVQEPSGTYFTLPPKYMLKSQLEPRAYGDTFARGGYEWGSDTYSTVQWGLEHEIPVEHEAASQTPVSLMEAGLRWLASQSNIRFEAEFAANYMKAGVWTTEDNNSATDWDDSSGTPITNIQSAKLAIRQLTGRDPNAMIMGDVVYTALLTNAQVSGALQYSTALTMTTRQQLLAQVLGLDTLAVSRAVQNVANLGQDADIDPIIDDDALLVIASPGTDMFGLSAIKNFTWEPGGGMGQVSTYYSDERRANVLQHIEQWDTKLISPDAGAIWLDIV